MIVLASLLIGYVNDGAERREFEQLETIHQQQQIIDAERERAERLLHQVLPAPIVARLKQSPGRVVQRHEAVTVMFADVVDFTALSVDLPAEEVVSLLDALFRWIDGLAAHHGVEKIKTIGDAYMAVAGAPDQRDDHAEAVAMLALDIQADLPLISRDLPKAVEVRIGMASGPAVAGLIGETRFTYDLWSDTVNTAARMQTSASPGSIHVDAEAARLLGGRFVLQEQHVDLKGKGSTTAWSLHGVRPRSLGS